MSFFSKVFRNKDGGASSKGNKSLAQNGHVFGSAPLKPRWEDAWTRKDVAPEEVHQLIRVCTQEMKSRALDMPFVLLPFRPNTDTADARIFIRNFFKAQLDGSDQYKGSGLQRELLLTEPLVLCSIMKWCWSRLPGGVVTWDAYELFKIGEQDSNMARHAFDTFIPLSVESDARKQIIFDFFELIAAIAAHGKANGLGGRKLSRLAGWWAFEHSDGGKGFDGGYKSWASAADATSHLFFAYLRSHSPDPAQGLSGINTLPRSLQALVSQTEYPPETPVLMQTATTKVVMIVNSVSPTPFSLLRRAKHFEYRDDDEALQEFSSYEDPVQALTDECRRVLNCISSTNQSTVMSNGTANGAVQEPSWSRFEDLGFSALSDSTGGQNGGAGRLGGGPPGLRTTPSSKNEFGRPTTPSWADFLSTGFPEDQRQDKPSLLLPPDKVLPPIGESRIHSSQSHLRNMDDSFDLEPGELASIKQFDLDETFWWVWMTSLAGEETPDRKAVFGRCALIETSIVGARWLVMEEQVKGASPGPEEGAYIAEKKSRFSFTRRGRLGRRKSTGKKVSAKLEEPFNTQQSGVSKTSIGPDQHARIQAAAAALKREQAQSDPVGRRRARADEETTTKTTSVMTLQPVIVSEAAPAMKWAKEFDKDAIRAKYLGDANAGKGTTLANSSSLSLGNTGLMSPPAQRRPSERDLPSLPTQSQPQTPMTDLPSPSPPPLPVVPQEKTYPIPTEAKQTPLPVPEALDEKRRPPPELTGDHPAYRKPLPKHAEPVLPKSPEPTPPERNAAVLAARRALEGRASLSPEPAAKRTEPKKLKKGPAPRALKNIFGRKKDGRAGPVDEPMVSEDRPGVTETAPAPAYNEVTSPEPKETKEPVPEPAPAPAPAPAPVPAPVPAPARESPAMDEYPPGPPAYASTNPSAPSQPRAEDTRPPLSRITSHEQREADRQFARFDQGPLEDVPAFVPQGSDGEDDDDDTEASAEPVPRSAGRPPPRAAPRMAPAVMEPSPPTPSPESKTEENASEDSEDLKREVSPVIQDRWAQIRKNAAERAARQSESEQSRPSQRTDDGETSGEETIESRVARIKARVAELTGNVDAQGSVAPAVRR